MWLMLHALQLTEDSSPSHNFLSCILSDLSVLGWLCNALLVIHVSDLLFSRKTSVPYSNLNFNSVHIWASILLLTSVHLPNPSLLICSKCRECSGEDTEGTPLLQMSSCNYQEKQNKTPPVFWQQCDDDWAKPRMRGNSQQHSLATSGHTFYIKI